MALAAVSAVPASARSQLRTLSHRGKRDFVVTRGGGGDGGQGGWDGAVSGVYPPSRDDGPWHGRKMEDEEGGGAGARTGESMGEMEEEMRKKKIIVEDYGHHHRHRHYHHHHREGGTDAAGAATWRVIQDGEDEEKEERKDDVEIDDGDGGGDGGRGRGREGKGKGKGTIVRFESFDRPGAFIGMCPTKRGGGGGGGDGRTACLVRGDDPTARFRLSTVTVGDDPLDPAGATLASIDSVVDPDLRLCPPEHVFGDGFDKPSESLTAAAMRFVRVADDAVKENPGGRHVCGGGFVLGPPLAQYPLVSFWGKGEEGDDSSPPQYLLVPLNEIVDESYNVYWE